MKTLLLIISLSFTSSLVDAQQLVYKPTNPAFGGDTFNYQWLMSSASSQNQFDDDQMSLNDAKSLDSFSQSLNRQLLSQLSQKLFGNQLGDGAIKAGTYSFGSLYLEISETSQGLLISILDTSNGEQSEIVVPK